MISAAAQQLEAAGIAVEPFIDPEKQQIEAAQRIGSPYRNQHRELRRRIALSYLETGGRSR
jgi:pyridoxine 5'-phosphate synthase PdxJ